MRTKLRQQSFALLVMLAVQFVLGMILNLFVTLPDKHPGQSGNYFVRSGHSLGWAITIGGGVALFLHVLLALGLIAGSIMLVVRAITARDKAWMWVSIVGLTGLLAAFSNGLSFLDFKHGFSSFIMAMGFIVTVSAYSSGLFMQTISIRSKK